MSETQPSVVGEYQDRRTWLLVVGILQIVMGAGAWLLALLSAVMAGSMARQGINTGSMISGVVFYGLGGAVFVALGVGTLRGRRWARAIWYVFSIGWLISGVIGLGAMIILMPGMIRNMIPEGAPTPPVAAMVVPMVVMGLFMLILMVVVPLIFLLFFRSPHVRATCEAMNPDASWTDALSAPLLAAMLWMGLLTVTFLCMPLAYQGVFPAFGRYLHGAVGIGLWVLAGVMCGVSTYGLSQRAVWGWSLAMLMVLLFAATSIVTYVEAGARELYEAMGMLPMQMEMMERMGLMSTGYMVGTTLMFVVPFLVLLFWARGSLTRE